MLFLILILNYGDMKKYVVTDNTNTPIRVFRSYKQAAEFKISRGRPDWDIAPLTNYDFTLDLTENIY